MDNQPQNPTAPQPGNPAPKPAQPATPATAPVPTASPQQPSPMVVSSDFSPPSQVISTVPGDTPPSHSSEEYSYNSLKIQHSGHGKLWLTISGAGAIVLVVVLIFYLLLLPAAWASTYQKNIKQPYEQQASQIASVYQSISNPVLITVGAGQATYLQQINNIKGLVQTALTNTNKLQTADHLTVLPGTTWSSSVSKANTQHQAMQTYVSDSQQFLTNYQTMLIYLGQISQILGSQLPALNNDFNTLNGAASISAGALAADVQTTNTDLQNITSKIEALKPSTDLKQFHQDLLNDFQSLNGSLQALSSLLQGNTAVDISNAVGELFTSNQDLYTLLHSNPTANIQTSSSLELQITKLQSEHPL